jgi:muconolactone delta-isomerase
MEFLVDMTTTVPDGTTQDEIAQMRSREAVRSAELTEQGVLLRLWRPPLQPGEWRSYGLFAAADAEEVELALGSMPLRVWRTDVVTPLSGHQNDPLGRQGSREAAPGTEFFTWFRFAIPADTDPSALARASEGEARRTAELALAGRLLRLWELPGDGRALGLWSAVSEDGLRVDLDSLPLVDWLEVEVTALTAHPSDPAQVSVG